MKAGYGNVDGGQYGIETTGPPGQHNLKIGGPNWPDSFKTRVGPKLPLHKMSLDGTFVRARIFINLSYCIRTREIV